MSNYVEFKLVIIEDGSEINSFAIGHSELSSLIDRAQDVPSNASLFIAASKHAASDIRSAAAQKEALPLENLQSLIDDGDISVRRAVLGQERFKRFVSFDKMKEIISGDTYMAVDVASNVDKFSEIDLEELCDLLQSHPDPAVSLALAESWSTPETIINRLINHHDTSVSQTAEKRLADFTEERSETKSLRLAEG